MDCSRVFRMGENARVVVWVLLILMIASMTVSCGGGGGNMISMPSNATGTVTVSISDPPSCKKPNGNFDHVYVTVRSVQALATTIISIISTR